ncbi:ABC transporter ATP-binding protein [Cohnella candidum]|uniref:ABC transporter ATP-binding protein n=1 Tax=Cohnella candidum TaxID=2674991 RepID=A0A3G3K442_9BACL|nr:ABC transporter ATP-binding protein [Cohnella candidum]AYQ75170.1 ABC transporter ATP-binding protein [Cohnella candidum]
MALLETDIAERLSPAAREQPVISLRGLSLAYGAGKNRKAVLKDVNLEIGENEFVVVLGASGCGKTSLLRLLAGYETHEEGEIAVLGSETPAPRPEVGVVFQQANLFPWLDIRRNVEFGLKMKRVSRQERSRIALETIRQVGLADYHRYLPYQLSGGMKQRAAIARTLAADPRVLLMDEPFGALDAITRENLQSLLKKIWRETRRTVFFITHDVDEALLLGSRIIVMSGAPGRIGLDRVNPLFREGEGVGQLRQHREYAALREELLRHLEKRDS